MIPNRFTPHMLVDGEASALDGVGVDTLFDLQQQIAELKDVARIAEAKLQLALDRSFGSHANAARADAAKITGQVSFPAGKYKVVANISKTVKWDQDRMQRLRQAILARGDDPSDYMDTEFYLHERKYSALPQYKRAELDQARRVTTGSQKYVLEGGE